MSSSIPDRGDIGKSDDGKVFEESPMDSGFISSGNMIVSEEIYDDDRVDDKEGQHSHKDDKERMLVDSGVVCVSENLSNLNLQNSNLNNLSSKSQKPVECNNKNSSKCTSEISWTVHYQQDDDGNTHLHTAIAYDMREAAYALIRIAPHPRLLDTPNDDALTPLHLATTKGDYQIVRWLIAAGARPGPRNLRGDSPLHVAIKLGDLNCCKAILFPVQNQEREQLQLRYPLQLCPTLDLEQWNYEGQTCLHIASEHGHVDILRMLVWCGADINAREGRAGYTALHYAVERNDENLIHFLLHECKKIDLNSTTYGGRSALQLGYPINENIANMLKQKGVASPYSSEDEYTSESDDESSDDDMSIVLLNSRA